MDDFLLKAMAGLCLTAGIILLCLMLVRFLKARPFADETILAFATFGIVFHLATMAEFVQPLEIFLGGLVGFLVLYVARLVVNRRQGKFVLLESDVKLVWAAGIWLGTEALILALAIGVLITGVHNAISALRSSTGKPNSINFLRLIVPAGPGLILGILIAGAIEFRQFRL